MWHIPFGTFPFNYLSPKFPLRGRTFLSAPCEASVQGTFVGATTLSHLIVPLRSQAATHRG